MVTARDARRTQWARLQASSSVAATLAMALVMALTLAVGARQQSRPAVSASTGTAALTVRVLVEGSDTAVKGARVSAILIPSRSTGPGGTSPATPGGATGAPPRDGATTPPRLARSAATDASGSAQFTGLPAGMYSLSVEPPAGTVRSRASSSLLEIPEARQAKATLRVIRGGVISGRLLDEDGDPAVGAQIFVFRQAKTVGGTRAVPEGNGNTQFPNDLGQYRVWSLAAGDYVVGAYTRSFTMPGDEALSRDGQVPTYFPGVLAADNARLVTVKAGQEAGSIDFMLSRGRLGSVTGRVTDASGASVQGPPFGGSGDTQVQVTLSSRGRAYAPGLSGRGAMIRPDGSFIIADVAPGDYYLMAVISRRDAFSRPTEAASLPVTVNGDEVAVTIQTNLGATVSGRIVVEGPVPPDSQGGAPGIGARPASATVMAIRAAPPYFPEPSSVVTADVRSDGTFELTGLRGSIQLTASKLRGAVKSVYRGASDIGGQLLEFTGTERIDDVVITLTEETGSIEGEVTDEQGVGVPGAPVIAFLDDEARWWPDSPFVRGIESFGASPASGVSTATSPGVVADRAGARTAVAPGHLVMSVLPPGRYAVIALPPDTSAYGLDHDQLVKLREGATVVNVEAGQIAAVHLRVTK
jgi:hypothetical protein